MLRERLARFLNESAVRRLSRQQHGELIRALLLYSLGRRGSEQLRQLALRFRVADELYGLKSTFFDRTHYMASIYWRGCFEYFRQLKTRTALGPDDVWIDEPALQRALDNMKALRSQKMRVECAADLRLIEAYLTVEDQRWLFRLARSSRYASPSEQDLVPIIKALQRYCRQLVRRYMRFIVRHDNGVSIDDLETSLFEAGLMTLRHFDAETNDLKLLNTAKRGAHNYYVRLVEFYSAQCRSRLVRHIEGKTEPYRKRLCGTCAWFDVAARDGKTCEDVGIEASHRPCRRKVASSQYHVRVISEARECGNCLYYDRVGPLDPKKSCSERNVRPTAPSCREFELRIGVEQFVSTTTSLDKTVGDENRGEGASLIDFIPEPRQDERESEWLDLLLGSLCDRDARIVRIVLGDTDDEFDSWLWYRTDRFTSEFSDSQIARYACEFLGVDLEDMRLVLTQYFSAKQAVR